MDKSTLPGLVLAIGALLFSVVLEGGNIASLANLPAAGDGGWILLVILLTVLVVLFATGKLKLN